MLDSERQPFLRRRSKPQVADASASSRKRQVRARRRPDSAVFERRVETRRLDCCCFGWCLLFAVLVLGSVLYLSSVWCALVVTGHRAASGGYCDSRSTDVVFHPMPALKHDLRAQLKINDLAKDNARDALNSGHFTHVQQLRQWDSAQHSHVTDASTTDDIEGDSDIILVENSGDSFGEVSAVVYSRIFNNEVGEMCAALNALHCTRALQRVVVAEDSTSIDALHLWSLELGLSKTQADNFEEQQSDDGCDTMRHATEGRILLRTLHLGLWRAIERGSKLTTASGRHIQRSSKLEKSDSSSNKMKMPSANVQLAHGRKRVSNEFSGNLLVFLDTKHRLALSDEWVADALQLFGKFEELKVLGGFTAVLKHGSTLSDATLSQVSDMSHMSHRRGGKGLGKETFAVLDTYAQDANRYDFETDASALNQLRRYYHSHLKQQMADWTQPVWNALSTVTGINSANGKNSNNANVSLEEYVWFERVKALRQREVYDENGKLVSVTDSSKQQLDRESLDGWDIVLEKVNARLKAQLQRYKDKNKGLGDVEKMRIQAAKAKVAAEKTRLLQTIPFFTEVLDTSTTESSNERKKKKLPFMFASAVRMGPVFVSEEWWFTKLLPHLVNVQNGKYWLSRDPNWFDIELSLWTWTLGGCVGLYAAKDWHFDKLQFKAELARNSGLDDQFNFYVMAHALLGETELGFDVWNMTHLVERNEDERLQKRTSEEPLTQDDFDLTLQMMEQFAALERNFF